MNDLVKIAMRRNPDTVIIHSGANDFTANVDTVAELRRVTKMIKETRKETKIAISLIIERNDQHKNRNSNIRQTNSKIKTFCQQNDIDIIDHPTIDKSKHLSAVRKTKYGNKGGLHPNNLGNAEIAKSFMAYVNRNSN